MGTVDIERPYGTKNSWIWRHCQADVRLTDEVAAGVTDHVIYVMAAGAHTVDEHADKLMASLETAPGNGKTVTVKASNGSSTMSVAMSSNTVFNMTTANAFDWDVSAQALTISFTTTAGTAVGRMGIHLAKHEVTIT